MTDQIAVVEFDVSGTAPFDVDVTSGNITETFSAAVLLFSHSDSDDTDNNHGLLGIGFIGASGLSTTNTLQTAVSCSLEHNQAAQDNETERTANNPDDGCVILTDGSAQDALDLVAEFKEAISGGVRLTFTTADVNAKCTAILFAGLSKAAAGNCTFTTTPSHEDIGTAGDTFEPDLIIFRSSDNTLTTDTPNGTLALGFAINRAGVPQCSAYVNWADRSEPADSDGYLRSDCASSAFTGTLRTTMDRFQVSSFDSTGFNGVAIVATTSPQANYLALKFSSAVRLACDNVAVSGSAGTQSFSLGLRPNVVLGMSTLLTTEDTLTDATSTAGYFAFTAEKARAYTVVSQEGLSTWVAKTRQGDYAVLTYANDQSVAQQATLSSFTDTGFDLSFSTATAGFLTVLAIELAPLKSTETVSISDTTLLVQASLQTTETVVISEQFVEASIHYLVANESVLISDDLATLGENMNPVFGDRLGVTAQDGAAQGSTAQDGTQAGVTAG